MLDWFKNILNKQNKDVELDLKVAASISLIFIALLLTILCAYIQKDLSTITISAYGILGAHSYFTNKHEDKDEQ